jgi:hypothetical protein
MRRAKSILLRFSYWLLIFAILSFANCTSTQGIRDSRLTIGNVDRQLTALADEYLRETMLMVPELTYFSKVSYKYHDRISDNSLEALERMCNRIREL